MKGRRQAAAVAARLAAPAAAPALPLPPGPPLGIWHSPLSRAADTAAAIARVPAPTTCRATPSPVCWSWHRASGKASPSRRSWRATRPSWRRGERTPPITRLPAARPSRPPQRGSGQPSRPSSTCCGEAQRSRGGAPAGGPDEGGSRVLGYEAQPGEVPRPWAILVAHDGILRLVLAQLLELPVERYWAFPFGLCNLTIVEMQHGAGRLRAHNLDEHLGSLTGLRVAGGTRA